MIAWMLLERRSREKVVDGDILEADKPVSTLQSIESIKNCLLYNTAKLVP